MFPILLEIGGFRVHTYGFFVALGVLAGILFARHEARKLKVSDERVLDLCFFIILAAIAGSRLFYAATNLSYYTSHPLEIFMIWKGGLVFYGGFAGAAAAVLVYLRLYRLPLGKCADIAGISLPLGHFIGRIGCFCAGCCYGRPCELPWAVTFTNPDSLAPLDVPLHPTQLYHCFGNLFIFAVLFLIRRRKSFDGQVFWVYVLLYGTIRSVIEIYRGDFRGPEIMGVLSVSQAMGAASALAAAVMLAVLSKKTRSSAKNG